MGDNITNFENNGRQLPISRVTLKVDDESVLTAGDDTGMELEADCPHATQAMVNAILAKVKGYRYQMFSAGDAGLDPAAELGDGITAGGVYSVISRLSDDGSGFPGITAPGEAELENEYPAAGPMSREFDRKIAETRSSITKTAEQIRLEVQNELQGLSSSITINLDRITSQVNGINGQVSKLEQTSSSLSSEIKTAEGNISKLQQTATGLQSQITATNGNVSSLWQTADSLQSQITDVEGNISSIEQNIDTIRLTVNSVAGYASSIEQKVDSIQLSVSNGESSSRISLSVNGVTISSKTIRFTGDVVFESDLSSGKTTISGDCITTGEISAEYIRLGGELTVYETPDSQYVGGKMGYITSTDFDGNYTSGMGMLDWDERHQVVVTDGGARLTSPHSEIVAATNATIKTERVINFFSNGFNSDQDLHVTSDRTMKEDIRYDVSEKYLPVFENLKPCSFLRKKKGPQRHLGFIAQEYVEAEKAAGILAKESVIVGEADGILGLTYSEMIPILVAKIKQLEQKIEEVKTWVMI